MLLHMPYPIGPVSNMPTMQFLHRAYWRWGLQKCQCWKCSTLGQTPKNPSTNIALPIPKNTKSSGISYVGLFTWHYDRIPKRGNGWEWIWWLIVTSSFELRTWVWTQVVSSNSCSEFKIKLKVTIGHHKMSGCWKTRNDGVFCGTFRETFFKNVRNGSKWSQYTYVWVIAYSEQYFSCYDIFWKTRNFWRNYAEFI